MIPASLAELNAMTISGPIKNPRKPISFKPKYIAISVASGDNPIWRPITFGSTVRRMANRTMANMESFVPKTTSPVKNTYNAHGPTTAIDPIIGMKSTTQMISDIIT